MNAKINDNLWLKILLMACIVSTAIHFTDNYIYFDKYPQPDSITPSSVYIAWIIWTAIGLAGYWLYSNEKFWLAYFCLAIYSFCGIDSLAHYLYGSWSEFSLKMHLFILTDGLTGGAILGFTLWSGLLAKKQAANNNQEIL